MIRRNEECSNFETCFMLAYCIFLFALGILLLYFKVLFGLGLVFVSALFFVPTLGEAKKKLAEHTKKRRIAKLRRTREVVIVGGTPQKHHKKKKQLESVTYPITDDFVSKGRAMRELGLFYEKKQRNVSFVEKVVEPTKSSVSGRTYRQLNELFNALGCRKRTRIAHDANIGAGHHGGSIKRMAEAEAKRRGVSISVRAKGKDMIITTQNKAKEH